MNEARIKIVEKILWLMLVFSLALVLVGVGFVAAFPERDNELLKFVRIGGLIFVVATAVIVSARGKLLKHIADNW
jgi:arginine exporter protein ArgO